MRKTNVAKRLECVRLAGAVLHLGPPKAGASSRSPNASRARSPLGCGRIFHEVDGSTGRRVGDEEIVRGMAFYKHAAPLALGDALARPWRQAPWERHVFRKR